MNDQNFAEALRIVILISSVLGCGGGISLVIRSAILEARLRKARRDAIFNHPPTRSED